MIAKMPKRIVEQFKVTASRMGLRLKTCVQDVAEKAKKFVAIKGEFPTDILGFSKEMLRGALVRVKPHVPALSKHRLPSLDNK